MRQRVCLTVYQASKFESCLHVYYHVMFQTFNEHNDFGQTLNLNFELNIQSSILYILIITIKYSRPCSHCESSNRSNHNAFPVHCHGSSIWLRHLSYFLRLQLHHVRCPYLIFSIVKFSPPLCFSMPDEHIRIILSSMSINVEYFYNYGLLTRRTKINFPGSYGIHKKNCDLYHRSLGFRDTRFA